MGVNKQQPNIHGLNQSMYKRCKKNKTNEMTHVLLVIDLFQFRSISEFDISESFKYDINYHLCCRWCDLSFDHDQCFDLVHFFVAVSTNRLVIFSTPHATASSIVLHYYYYHISCICIYYVYRPGRSKSTTSFQNLYPPPTTTTAAASTETKTTTSTYPTPVHPRRQHHYPTQSPSVRLDSGSMLFNQVRRANQIMPQTAASNRLRTFRSLLMRDHKTMGMDSMSNLNDHHRHNRDLDSTLSEYQIRSLTQSVLASQLPKSRYEEQEDCVELKSECSVLTNHNHGLMNRNKSNQIARQINSWDDI